MKGTPRELFIVLLSHVPRGPFGLIAGRLGCLSYEMFSFLLGDTFFVVVLQMAWFLKRPPPRRLTNVRGSSALLKGRDFYRDLAFCIPLFQTFSLNRTCADPIIINRLVIIARVARKIPLNNHRRPTTIIFKKINAFKRFICVSQVKN